MIHLIEDDCRNALNTIGTESIDLTVTSPPYDNLRTYKDSLEWSFEIFQEIAQQLFRVTKQGGVVVWVVGDATIKGSETGTSFKQALYFKEIGFNLHDTMIWNKGSCRYPEINRYYPTFEYMFILTKGKPSRYNLLSDRKNKYQGSKVARKKQMRGVDGIIRENSAYRNDKNRLIKAYGVRFNIWEIPVSACEGGKEHPATFPEQLAHDHIISWSNEGDTVLDPFMGSGTTGKIAKMLNRKFIGIEKVPEYMKIAKQRISEAGGRGIEVIE